MPDFQHFFGAAPTYQNALDLFKGEWSTRLPDASGFVASTGNGRHAEDPRIVWASERLGGFRAKTILELGPLEGGHTLMLEKFGAEQVVAVEGNARAFIKCLIVKEVFGLTRARFIPADFIQYLETCHRVFDTTIACGVLYHLLDPLRAIEQIAKHTKELFVWTHYCAENNENTSVQLEREFEPPVNAVHAGFNYTRNIRHYGASLQWKGFCGGCAENACWLYKNDLLSAFEHFGFEIIEAVEDANPNGPAVMFVAKKKGHNIAPVLPFQEDLYLSRYPDVKAAVAAGIFRSGAHHYAVCGAHEGRTR